MILQVIKYLSNSTSVLIFSNSHWNRLSRSCKVVLSSFNFRHIKELERQKLTSLTIPGFVFLEKVTKENVSRKLSFSLNLLGNIATLDQWQFFCFLIREAIQNWAFILSNSDKDKPWCRIKSEVTFLQIKEGGGANA